MKNCQKRHDLYNTAAVLVIFANNVHRIYLQLYNVRLKKLFIWKFLPPKYIKWKMGKTKLGQRTQTHASGAIKILIKNETVSLGFNKNCSLAVYTRAAVDVWKLRRWFVASVGRKNENCWFFSPEIKALFALCDFRRFKELASANFHQFCSLFITEVARLAGLGQTISIFIKKHHRSHYARAKISIYRASSTSVITARTLIQSVWWNKRTEPLVRFFFLPPRSQTQRIFQLRVLFFHTAEIKAKERENKPRNACWCATVYIRWSQNRNIKIT